MRRSEDGDFGGTLRFSALESAVFGRRFRGKLRLARAYSRLCGLDASPFAGVADVPAGRFRVDTSRLEDWAMVFGGMEELQIGWIRRTFGGRLYHGWDIGAHHGLYAVALGRLVGPTGTVHAFEPFPESVQILRENVSLNRLEDVVHVHPTAVSDRSGTSTLQLSTNGPQNHSLTSAIAFSGEELEVEVTTMDDVADRSGDPQFVKIDVEGGEYEAFLGGDRLLGRRKTCFLFESEPWDARRVAVHELVESYGYALSTLQQGRERPGVVGRMLIARPRSPG